MKAGKPRADDGLIIMHMIVDLARGQADASSPPRLHAAGAAAAPVRQQVDRTSFADDVGGTGPLPSAVPSCALKCFTLLQTSSDVMKPADVVGVAAIVMWTAGNAAAYACSSLGRRRRGMVAACRRRVPGSVPPDSYSGGRNRARVVCCARYAHSNH